MADSDKYLDKPGLAHLIGLIKGAISGAQATLQDAIDNLGTDVDSVEQSVSDLQQQIESGSGDIPADEVTITDNDDSALSLKPGGIQPGHLSNGCVTTDKIASSAVTTDKIASSAVTSDKLADGSVGTSALASSSITTEKYADGSVTYAKLADDVEQAITQPQMGRDFGAYTWQELMQLANDPANAAEDFAYMVGQTKPLQIAGYGNFIFRMIGVGQDVRSDNGQFAKMTFEIVDIPTTHRMNPSDSTTGGWGDSEMREWLNSTMLNALPDYMIDGITTVKKEYKNGESGSIVTCDDKLWCLSEKELTNGTTYGDEGEFYEYWASHNNADDRIKKYNESAHYWWLRSVNSSASFRRVGSTGVPGNSGASLAYGVVFCFCIG